MHFQLNWVVNKYLLMPAEVFICSIQNTYKSTCYIINNFIALERLSKICLTVHILIQSLGAWRVRYKLVFMVMFLSVSLFVQLSYVSTCIASLWWMLSTHTFFWIIFDNVHSVKFSVTILSMLMRVCISCFREYSSAREIRDYCSALIILTYTVAYIYYLYIYICIL